MSQPLLPPSPSFPSPSSISTSHLPAALATAKAETPLPPGPPQQHEQKPRQNHMTHTLFPSWPLTKCHHPNDTIAAMLGCFAFCLIRSGQFRSDQVRSHQHSLASCRPTTAVKSLSVCAAKCLTTCVNRRRAMWRQLLPHRLSVLLRLSHHVCQQEKQLLPHSLSVLLTISSCLSTGEERRGGSCCHTSTG